MDYLSAKGMLDRRPARWRDSMKVANSTYLERHDDCIAVRLHSTDIVRFHPNGDVSLHTGGWKTPTTKDRINLYAPGRVSSERGDWFFVYRGATYAFESGLTVRADGSVTGDGDLEAIYKRWRERDREPARRERDRETARRGYWLWRARPFPNNRLTADDVMGERDYTVQEAKARLFGHARLLAAIGEVRDEDNDYQVLSFAFNHYRELVGLRCKADNTIAVIKSITIKDGLFEALRAGFQKV